jgi:hypothetical protein
LGQNYDSLTDRILIKDANIVESMYHAAVSIVSTIGHTIDETGHSLEIALISIVALILVAGFVGVFF